MSKHLIIFPLTDVVKMEVSIILLFLFFFSFAIVTRSRSARNLSFQCGTATQSKAEVENALK